VELIAPCFDYFIAANLILHVALFATITTSQCYFYSVNGSRNNTAQASLLNDVNVVDYV
jgi:hypothetical protein